MTKDSQKAVFIAHARSLLGARWRHRGRKPWALDCIGLLVLSARAAGWPLQDQSHYGREPWEDRLRLEMRRQLGNPVVQKEDAEPGDVALVRWGAREPSHVAIVADYVHGGLSMIHCENINGCVEHGIDDYYASCILEVYRPCAKFSQ